MNNLVLVALFLFILVSSAARPQPDAEAEPPSDSERQDPSSSGQEDDLSQQGQLQSPADTVSQEHSSGDGIVRQEVRRIEEKPPPDGELSQRTNDLLAIGAEQAKEIVLEAVKRIASPDESVEASCKRWFGMDCSSAKALTSVEAVRDVLGSMVWKPQLPNAPRCASGGGLMYVTKKCNRVTKTCDTEKDSPGRRTIRICTSLSRYVLTFPSSAGGPQVLAAGLFIHEAAHHAGKEDKRLMVDGSRKAAYAAERCRELAMQNASQACGNADNARLFILDIGHWIPQQEMSCKNRADPACQKLHAESNIFRDTFLHKETSWFASILAVEQARKDAETKARQLAAQALDAENF